MTIFFKDMFKVSNKIEYAVIGFKRDMITKYDAKKVNISRYIADTFDASLMYSYNSCIDLSIAKARPTINDDKYKSNCIDWYAIPVVKVIPDRDMISKIRLRINKQKRYNEGLQMSITDLVKKYTNLNTSVVFPKRKNNIYDQVDFNNLAYEGKSKGWYTDRHYQVNTYYAILSGMEMYKLNPDVSSTILQGGKLEAFDLVWRECIDRRLKKFDLHISKHDTKVAPYAGGNYDAEIALDYNSDIQYADRALNKVCSEIVREITDIVKERVNERLAELKEILDSCHIDSEEVLNKICTTILNNSTSISRLRTHINLEELMK